MKDAVLEIRGLSKIYGQKKVLDQVSITLQKGRIYGLVGQNGAGKTTLMRIIGGLVFPDQGEITLFGAKDKKGLAQGRKQLGYLMEDWALYPYMTAKENMEIMKKARGVSDQESILTLLTLLGLAESGQKKVVDFSLGMKRRLGIALALLGKPKFLLLDEPTNGLDALGVLEIRVLLQKLAQEEGVTMLISSHMLTELSHLVSDFIIIDQGHILQEITKQQLTQCCHRHLVIRVEDLDLGTRVLAEKLQTKDFQVRPDGSILLSALVDETEKIRTVFAENGVVIHSLEEAEDSVENYFINLIGGMDHV